MIVSHTRWLKRKARTTSDTTFSALAIAWKSISTLVQAAISAAKRQRY